MEDEYFNSCDVPLFFAPQVAGLPDVSVYCFTRRQSGTYAEREIARERVTNLYENYGERWKR